MLYYNNPDTDPTFNLALEEYLMGSYPSEDILMLWQSRPGVLIGRYQDTYDQINRAFVEENGLAVVRRITGGGAVYQDLGNVNFSFIIRGRHDYRYPFKKLADPGKPSAGRGGRFPPCAHGARPAGNGGPCPLEIPGLEVELRPVAGLQHLPVEKIRLRRGGALPQD